MKKKTYKQMQNKLLRAEKARLKAEAKLRITTNLTRLPRTIISSLDTMELCSQMRVRREIWNEYRDEIERDLACHLANGIFERGAAAVQIVGYDFDYYTVQANIWVVPKEFFKRR